LGAGWVLVAGAEGKYHLRKELLNYEPGGATYLDTRRTSTAASLYAQLEAPLASWLRIVAGARWDKLGDAAEAVSPRVALILQPLADTTVKAMLGRAFRPPNDAELHWESPGYWKAPGLLRPEIVRTYELAVEQKVGRGLRLGASAYHYDAMGLVDGVVDPADGLGTYANGGSVAAMGVEVEGHQRWASGAGLRASWALQRAEDAAGRRISNSPASVGKLQLHGPLGLRHLRGGAELLYLSARRTDAGGTVPGYLLANLNLRATGLASGALELAVGIDNVLGTSYAAPASSGHVQEALAREGRVFTGSATWRF
jgi:iron complex outermembrane receptor protein